MDSMILGLSLLQPHPTSAQKAIYIDNTPLTVFISGFGATRGWARERKQHRSISKSGS